VDYRPECRFAYARLPLPSFLPWANFKVFTEFDPAYHGFVRVPSLLPASRPMEV
jgi:hypothetical protein